MKLLGLAKLPPFGWLLASLPWCVLVTSAFGWNAAASADDGPRRAFPASLASTFHLLAFQSDFPDDSAPPVRDDEDFFLNDWEAGLEPMNEVAEEGAPSVAPAQPQGLNLFELFWQSRWWMLPIGIMSVIVLAVAVERWLNLQRARVVPRRFVKELEGLVSHQYGFDPREAFRVCQRYPSAAASVVKAMLLKVGRPQSELEHAVREASEREAQRLYNNVRWLNLASGVTPLMGLMGTVWGMIRAFHDTTQMAPGLNKAEYLAEGIYLALVTTLAGLAVAIPATILSHYFEGRVLNLFHQIDELLLGLMPQVERFEGGGRLGSSPVESPPVQVPPASPPATAVPSRTSRSPG